MRTLLLLFALGLGSALTAGAAERPNILIIFTDDQGYADLACYGNTKNKTPRLDRLAREGTRFTSFYTQTVCGPSRSALLSGRYPRISKGWGMPAEEITIAEQLKGVGYQTVCIGKWDVSNRKPILPRMPNAQGFHYFYGALGANDNGTVRLTENNEAAGSTKDMGGLTTLYTDKSIEWLENTRDPKKPFLLYLSHTMMHTIVDASPAFRGTSAGGLYGDVVEEFDFETGRLLDTLDRLELSQNTLVIYTSDNGPWNQDKYTNAACIARWPGKVPAGRESAAMWATIDFMPTFATLAGYKAPSDRLMDGVDQTALLLGQRETGREDFYFDRAGIRIGNWKYLKPDAHFYGYSIEDDRPKEAELYDLEADLGETTNLSAKHPDIVERLRTAMATLEGRKDSLNVATGPDRPAGLIGGGERLQGRIPLAAGQSYHPDKSPVVLGKSVEIRATIEAAKRKQGEGVIVAQGGTLVGYTLFLRDRQVVFGVRSGGKLKELRSEAELGKDPVDIVAKLGVDGTRSLTVAGAAVKAEGPALDKQPAMGLSVGEDQGPNIADYKQEQFGGTISTLELWVK